MSGMRSLTIKLPAEQDAWLSTQARALKRSKGAIIRELIARQRTSPGRTVADALADLRGCLKGAKDLSTRSLKGYGRG